MAAMFLFHILQIPEQKLHTILLTHIISGLPNIDFAQPLHAITRVIP
jgi:hypothetical protein